MLRGLGFRRDGCADIQFRYSRNHRGLAISNADAGLIGTATLLTSAFGGWFAGALSDRFDRARTLQITIIWFAFFTFLCDFAQSYTPLFIFRALVDLGFGGEWAAGAGLTATC